MDKEIETSLIAGNFVKFVYLDPEGNEMKNTEFTARCHFLPCIGDQIKLGEGKQIAIVKRVYHSFVQNEEFEAGKFFQAVTVVLTSRSPLQKPELH
jgi:D-lyxose ketol-isomerase